jgi:PAS domain-containing protein
MAQRLPAMSDLTASILEAIPSPIFVVDEGLRIIGYNLAASALVGGGPETVIRRHTGEALHCLSADKYPEGCGRAEFCKDCVVLTAVNAAIQGGRVVRKRMRMELVREGTAVDCYLLVTTSPFNHQDVPLVLLILEDINELMELKGILPICAHCKKIRDDQQYWQSIEKYFKDHLDLDFSHGICPQCVREFYPEIIDTPGS